MNRRAVCMLFSLSLAACGPSSDAQDPRDEDTELDSKVLALETPLPTGKRTIRGWLTINNAPPGGPSLLTISFAKNEPTATLGPCCSELVGYRVHFTRTGDHSFRGVSTHDSWQKKVKLDLTLDPVTGGGKVDLDVITQTYTTYNHYVFTGSFY